MHSLTRRILVGLGGTSVAVLAMAAPAFAGTITAPTPAGSPAVFTTPVNSTGNPVPFTVSGSGYAQGPVYLEICNGVSPSSPGYDVNANCDAQAAGAAVQSPGTASGNTGSVTFPASNSNVAIRPFRGVGPGDLFNCLAPEDASGPPASDGSVNPNGATTVNGQQIDNSVESFTNCQIRLSSSLTSNADGSAAYETISIPNSGSRVTPTVTLNPIPGNAAAGSPQTITGTVAGGAVSPTGTVSLIDQITKGGVPQAFNLAGCQNVAVTNGTFSCTTSGLQVGANSVTASYTGDGTYAAAASPATSYTGATVTPPPATPEVPLAALLPAAAVAVMAGGYGINRRRNRRAGAEG